MAQRCTPDLSRTTRAKCSARPLGETEIPPPMPRRNVRTGSPRGEHLSLVGGRCRIERRIGAPSVNPLGGALRFASTSTVSKGARDLHPNVGKRTAIRFQSLEDRIGRDFRARQARPASGRQSSPRSKLPATASAAPWVHTSRPQGQRLPTAGTEVTGLPHSPARDQGWKVGGQRGMGQRPTEGTEVESGPI